MGHIIAISNRKGGTGKSTSTLNIGAALARKGYRVLLVDLDPQANLTQAMGLETAPYTIHGALVGLHRLQAVQTGVANLALVAGSSALSALERQRGHETGSELLLRQLLADFRERCDFILLDCPPALDLLTINAYACATQVYVPLEAQLFSTSGFELVVKLTARVQQQLNPSLVVGGCFFTRFDRRKILRREVSDELRATYPNLVLTTTIRETVALSEAPHLRQDIFTYAASSAGAADYQALTEEILQRCPVALPNG
jgi:chromosome partitioning protein